MEFKTDKPLTNFFNDCQNVDGVKKLHQMRVMNAENDVDFWIFIDHWKAIN